MITNYNNTQPTFGAKLVVKGLKLDADKLEEVGKKLVEKTHHYPNDKLSITKEVVKGDNGQNIHILDFGNNKIWAGFITEIDEFQKWFEKTPVEEIAKSFTRVFKYAKLKEVEDTAMSILRNRFTRALNHAELNRTKFALTNKQTFKTLSTSNEKRAKLIDTEIKKSEAYYRTLGQKITNNPLNNLMNWW